MYVLKICGRRKGLTHNTLLRQILQWVDEFILTAVKSQRAADVKRTLLAKLITLECIHKNQKIKISENLNLKNFIWNITFHNSEI